MQIDVRWRPRFADDNNAFGKSFFGEMATLEWVSWFNHHRLLEPIGYIPPAEAEANYYRHLVSQTSTVEV